MWSNMCLAIVWSPVTLNKLISGETQGQQRVLSRTWGHVNDMLMLTCETVTRMSSIWSVLLINNPLLIHWIFQLWDMFFIWSFFLSKKKQTKKKPATKKRSRKGTKNVQVCIASADGEHFSVLLIALICFHTGYLCSAPLWPLTLWVSWSMSKIICLSCSVESAQRFPVTPRRQMKGVMRNLINLECLINVAMVARVMWMYF